MKTVYILTNQAMPGIIKIGFTENSVEQRMRELDKTPTPIPFECYYAKRIEKAEFVEKKMHEAFDEFRRRDIENLLECLQSKQKLHWILLKVKM